MAMTPDIMPPGKLNVTSTENMTEDWKVSEQKWNNYVNIAKLGTKPQKYKVALFLHCIGVGTLKIFNGFQFDTPEDRNTLSKIIDKFDQYTIGEVNETLKDTILTQETKKRMKALPLGHGSSHAGENMQFL